MGRMRAAPPTHAPVLNDPRVGERAARPHRPQRQLAVAGRLVRHGRVEHLARKHPLGEVVRALEAADPSGDHELAGVPERLEDHLRRLPVPHPAAALAVEVAGRQRAALADRREHLLGELGMLRDHVAAPRVMACHPEAEERPLLDRDETGLVRPVLEDPTLAEQA